METAQGATDGETEMTYATQNCTDFSTSTGFAVAGCNTAAAWAEADRRCLAGRDASMFAQGFIHARQGRTDLAAGPDVSASYAAGYAAA